MVRQYIQAERLISALELAEHLHLAEETVRRMAREGTLPSIKAGRRVRFSLSQVLYHLEQKK